MIATRLLKTAHFESPGAGIFGWTVIHVHVNIVDRQLQSMPYIDRVSNRLSSRMKMDWKWFLGRFCGCRQSVGRAKVFQGREKKERYKRERRIILSMIAATKPGPVKLHALALPPCHGMGIFTGELYVVCSTRNRA